MFKHFGESQLLIPQLDIRSPKGRSLALRAAPGASRRRGSTPQPAGSSQSELFTHHSSVRWQYEGPLLQRRSRRHYCYLHENLSANTSLEWKLKSTFSYHFFKKLLRKDFLVTFFGFFPQKVIQLYHFKILSQIFLQFF